MMRREPKFGMFLGTGMDVGLARRLSKGGHDWLAVDMADGSESRRPEEPETLGALIAAIAEGSAENMASVYDAGGISAILGCVAPGARKGTGTA